MDDILSHINRLESVFSESPSHLIHTVEKEISTSVKGKTGLLNYLVSRNIDKELLQSALKVKKMSGQINVIVHAVGILTALNYILETDEKIIAISLGAGNTGKRYDLETNLRVAEFKFINWRGGAESIRQNGVFKDFFGLLLDESDRKKQLYLNGISEASKFLNGNRALSSVLSKNESTRNRFHEKYEYIYSTVGEFYRKYRKHVELIDLNTVTPETICL
jgi:hypothetical protein